MSGPIDHPFGRVESNSTEQTLALARRLGEALAGGETIALSGGLGAGKTVFSKGLAAGLGVEEIVVSPTFLLVRSYRGRAAMHHFDFYRLVSAGDLDSFGFEEYFEPDAVCVIEWADRFPECLPSPHLAIHISVLNDDKREIAITAVGGELRKPLLEAISNLIQSD